MFRTLRDKLSICLEGTILFSRPKEHARRPGGLWSYSLQGPAAYHPYVLTQDEYKIKFDLISKLHSVDNRLQATREQYRRGRAKWMPDLHQQTYDPPLAPPPNPQVELYYKLLGLACTREPHATWQMMPAVHH